MLLTSFLSDLQLIITQMQTAVLANCLFYVLKLNGVIGTLMQSHNCPLVSKLLAQCRLCMCKHCLGSICLSGCVTLLPASPVRLS